MTSSFGSICFGAFLISVIQTIRAMVNAAARQRGNQRNIGVVIFFCIVRCLLGCIERAAEVFNEFGFAYVSIYGYSYCDSCQRVMDLFKRKGWTALNNENLVSMAL